MFQFYEKIELQLLDQRFIIRGTIPLSANVGTIDIDNITLEKEGRFQDWTRNKYAEVINALKDLNARMIGFDVFFPESSAVVLKIQDLKSAQTSDINEVYTLFRDYDEELRTAMLDAGNVLLGQNFEAADPQNADWVRENTAGKSAIKVTSLQLLEPYSLDYPDWPESKLIFYRDIETPLPKLISASQGVGYAMTEADIDGSVRHYPVVLVYDGRIWPSLALIMVLEYIGADFRDITFVPGKELILPPGKLPDGTEVNIRIPVNKKGLMMVNWTGDWAQEQFFHVPHLALVTNKRAWKQADIARTIKRIFNNNQETINNREALISELEEYDLDFDEEILQIYSTLSIGKYFEQEFIAKDIILNREDLPEDAYDFYQELVLNHKIAKAFEEDPSLTLEAMKEKIGERNEEKFRRGYYILRDIFSRDGLKDENYPLYFFDPEVSGRILKKEDFEGKVFIYGLTAAGTQDLNPMPYSHRYPMVGLYANIFNTIITQDFLRRASFSTDAFIILFFGFLTGILVPRFKPLTGASIILLVLGLYLVLAQSLFQVWGLWVDVLGTVAVIIVGYTSITVYSFFSEEKEKKMIRGIFSRYVTKSVVDELIKNPDMVKLGGEKKVLTVFFSDVAGFTAVSEQLTPEELVSLLNEYLTAMSNIILKYDGMIDKYEGDAIMAVFGTPIMYSDHPARACYVSLEMQEELKNLRKKWKEEGKPELYVRIGLNTGPMVAGNMGAADRLDYTVMGDSVNLGSRLEGANKQYNTSIMISESTYTQAEKDIEARFLDSLRVKGKKLPVKVYELLARKENGLPEDVQKVKELYENGMERYLAREWDKGLEFFNKALSIKPGDGPSKVYVDRCLAFKENPPPDDWDGVYVMTTK